MPRTSNLKPAFRPERHAKGLAAWVANIPSELSPTGKRQQLFFSTKTEAQTECEKLKARRDNFGISLSTMTSARIAAAAEAYNILDLQGIDLLDAVRAHVRVISQKSASVTFEAAFDRFAELKQAKSTKYCQEIRQVRTRFEYLFSRQICDVSHSDLEPILDKLPGASRNAHMRRLRSVFNLAIKRGWIQPWANPIGRLDFADRITKEVEVYETDEAARMLEYALENEVELVPFLALGLFCGIRPDGELQKLVWTDLKFDGEIPQVVIRPEVSKIKRRRFVDISPNARAWLDAYRNAGGTVSGPIIPFSANVLRKKRRNLWRAAKVRRWIQQGMRHTYCSCWLAKHKDANRLVLQSGHTDANTMWERYHRGVTEADAEKFWSIKPPTDLVNVIAFQKQA